MSVVTEFTEWLKGEMHKRKWSATDLAKESGISGASISAILGGTRGVGAYNARAIAHALGLSEVQLFVRAGLLSGLESDQAETILDDPQVVEYLELLKRIKQSRPDALEYVLEQLRLFLRFNP